MTLWPAMMHYHTKFGYKRLSSSEDILWTKSDTQTDQQTEGHGNSSIPHPLTLLPWICKQKQVPEEEKKHVL